MKRILFVAAAIFVCVAMSAQSKGEKSISGSLVTTFGNSSVKTYNGITTNTQDVPTASEFNVMAGFGYFVSDHLRFAIGMGVPIKSTPDTPSGDTWLKTKTTGFMINPNIAYYMRVADRLYYNPEIGYLFGTGSVKKDLTPSTTHNANYNGHIVYLNFLSLEFRASQKFAIGTNIGDLSYSYSKIKDKDSEAYASTGEVRCDLNKAEVYVSFYF